MVASNHGGSAKMMRTIRGIDGDVLAIPAGLDASEFADLLDGRIKPWGGKPIHGQIFHDNPHLRDEQRKRMARLNGVAKGIDGDDLPISAAYSLEQWDAILSERASLGMVAQWGIEARLSAFPWLKAEREKRRAVRDLSIGRP